VVVFAGPGVEVAAVQRGQGRAEARQRRDAVGGHGGEGGARKGGGDGEAHPQS
jgi:hypothetical protein